MSELMREYPATILRYDEAALHSVMHMQSACAETLSLCLDNQCFNRGLDEKAVVQDPSLVSDDDLLIRVAQLQKALQLWVEELTKLWNDYMLAAAQAEQRDRQ
jgi:hypothetical protein